MKVKTRQEEALEGTFCLVCFNFKRQKQGRPDMKAKHDRGLGAFSRKLWILTGILMAASVAAMAGGQHFHGGRHQYGHLPAHGRHSLKDGEGWTRMMIDKACSHNIPVITMQKDVPNSKRQGFVGINDYFLG